MSAQFEAALHGFTRAMLQKVPGQLGVYILKPPAGSREYGVLRRFASTADRDAFYRSPDYVRWQMSVAPLLEGEVIYRTLTGLETWLSLPGQETIVLPPRWKTALVTCIGVYPTSLFTGILIEPMIHHWHIAIKGLLLAALSVALLTWLIMPLITRLC